MTQYGWKHVFRVLGGMATAFAVVLTVWVHSLIGLLPGLAVALFGWSLVDDLLLLRREWLWARATPSERGTGVTFEQCEDGLFNLRIVQNNIFPNERTVDFRITREQAQQQVDGMVLVLRIADQNNEASDV